MAAASIKTQGLRFESECLEGYQGILGVATCRDLPKNSLPNQISCHAGATSSTTPATSMPGIKGNVTGWRSFIKP